METKEETLSRETTEVAPAQDAYVTFPPFMNIYFSWAQAKHFFVCGASKQERLYCVEVHTGFSRKGMLGSRPGCHFHRGLSLDDPVIAAVGYETMQSAGIASFDSDSVVVLPPYDPCNPKSTLQTVEKMVASTAVEVSEKSGKHRRVVFSFKIEVGPKMVRERFEWRQILKGEESSAEIGGFKLVRLGRRASRNDEGAESSEAVSKKKDGEDGQEAETVAILAWVKGWFGVANVLSTHPFSLSFVGSAKRGELGNRWALMAVLTALRIDNLHKMGRTSPTSVHIGEKIRDGASGGSQGQDNL